MKVSCWIDAGSIFLHSDQSTSASRLCGVLGVPNAAKPFRRQPVPSGTNLGLHPSLANFAEQTSDGKPSFALNLGEGTPPRREPT